jgi:hypothetical protein
MLSATLTRSSITSAYSSERPLLVHHVARICGISRRTVRWAAAQGLLKGFKDPRTPKIWRFWRQDVNAFLERRAQELSARTASAGFQVRLESDEESTTIC